VRVIIAGIGSVGKELAINLSQQANMELVLIDSNEEKCEDLSRDFDALVLHGDGTESDILDKAGAREADALIASTESDALNTVIGMLAKKMKVPRVIVKLADNNLRIACKEIGIDHIVSPTSSAVTEISSLLHGHEILDFSLLIKGGTRLIDLSPGKKADKKIRDIDLPSGSLIISIVRDYHIIVPKGNTQLLENDVLLILAESEKIANKIKSIFGKPKEAPKLREP
jgi:trk system potassium uptake protein